MRWILLAGMVALTGCGPAKRDVDFNTTTSLSAAERAEADALDRKIRAGNAVRAKEINTRVRANHRRAVAACEGLESAGHSSPRCPPKPPVCIDEQGTSQEVPC